MLIIIKIFYVTKCSYLVVYVNAFNTYFLQAQEINVFDDWQPRNCVCSDVEGVPSSSFQELATRLLGLDDSLDSS